MLEYLCLITANLTLNINNTICCTNICLFFVFFLCIVQEKIISCKLLSNYRYTFPDVILLVCHIVQMKYKRSRCKMFFFHISFIHFNSIQKGIYAKKYFNRKITQRVLHITFSSAICLIFGFHDLDSGDFIG